MEERSGRREGLPEVLKDCVHAVKGEESMSLGLRIAVVGGM